MENRENKEIQLDIFSILQNFWKYKFLILLICVLCAVLTYARTTFRSTPLFISTTELFVVPHSVTQSETSTKTTYNDLMMSKQISADIEKIVTNVEVTEKVVDRLKLGVSPSAVASSLSVYTKAETRILVISVTDSDPFRATLIANTIRDITTDKIVDSLGLNAIKIISEARIPSSPIDNGAKRTAGIVFFAVLLVCLGVLVLMEFFNDTVKTPEDVERYLGISTLGSIPRSNSMKSDD